MEHESDFKTKIKELAFQAKGIHFMINPYDLASKDLLAPLQEVLNSFIQIVN